MAGAEGDRSGRHQIYRAALLGVLFGILACVVLALSLWSLGLLLQLAT